MPEKIEGSDKYFKAVYSIRETDLQKLEKIKEFNNTIVYIGPSEPPLEMLKNLNGYTINHKDNEFFNEEPQEAQHEVLPLNTTAPKDIIKMLDEDNRFVIQGPPGTGKSYLIANIAQELASQNKSVLVTTLANKALLEVVEKEPLAYLLENNRLRKKALASEVHNRIPKLQELEDVIPQVGEVHFATYFSASGSKLLTDNNLKKYDCVIVDEASQAFLSFLAATLSLGQKQIFLGDVNQLPPVVELNKDKIKLRNYSSAIDGLRVISKFLKVYQLIDTFRLNHYSASCTSLFYTHRLNSKNDVNKLISLNIFNRTEELTPGTYFISINNIDNLNLVTDLCQQFYNIKPTEDKRIKSRTALLTHKVSDVQKLYKTMKLSCNFTDERLVVDTVHRCQGMTVDFAIYYIPKSNIFAWDTALFNVATSRAKLINIIISDDVSLGQSNVANFIEKLRRDGHVISQQYIS
jgi:superfamily I DNA and/or RNA helicase